MAAKVDLEVMGVIENMSGFTTPDGERFTIFGEGGGQLLADELDVPLLGKIPLSEELREHADEGTPLVTAEPDAPASQAIRQAARGIVADDAAGAAGAAGGPATAGRRRSAAPSCRSSSSGAEPPDSAGPGGAACPQGCHARLPSLGDPGCGASLASRDALSGASTISTVSARRGGWSVAGDHEVEVALDRRSLVAGPGLDRVRRPR